MLALFNEFRSILSKNNSLNEDIFTLIRKKLLEKVVVNRIVDNHYKYLSRDDNKKFAKWFSLQFKTNGTKGFIELDKKPHTTFDKSSCIIKQHNLTHFGEDSYLNYHYMIGKENDNIRIFSFSYGPFQYELNFWSSNDKWTSLLKKMTYDLPLCAYYIAVVDVRNEKCCFLHLPEQPYPYIFKEKYENKDYFICFFRGIREIWFIDTKGKLVSTDQFPEGVNNPWIELTIPGWSRFVQ